MAVLGVLMLRGAQTPGELKARTERLHPFASLGEIHQMLDDLIQRELVARLPRRPGQKEERYLQLLGGEDGGEDGGEHEPQSAAPAPGSDLEERIGRLEDEVATLRRALEALALRVRP
jgi:uncharacterized protein YceH (UPF0502 family)